MLVVAVINLLLAKRVKMKILQYRILDLFMIIIIIIILSKYYIENPLKYCLRIRSRSNHRSVYYS